MPRTALRLEPEEALPALMARRLEPHRDLLMRTASWEKARTHPELRRIEDELEAHLQALTLKAYHCTREPEKGFFARRGLRLTSLQLHQAEFLAYYGARFTDEEREDIKRAWADYFSTAAPWGVGRDGMVWACLWWWSSPCPARACARFGPWPNKRSAVSSSTWRPRRLC